MEKIRKVQAIIYDIKNNKPHYLILHRTLRWKGWELLKETMEKGETHEQTIIRGIKEEIEIKNFKITKKIDKKIEFAENNIIEKIFLIRVNMDEKIDLLQDVIEHDGFKWVTKEEALKLLTFDNAKELIENIHSSLPE